MENARKRGRVAQLVDMKMAKTLGLSKDHWEEQPCAGGRKIRGQVGKSEAR